MLLDCNIQQKPIKLKVQGTTTARAPRTIADDTVTVKARMQELFSCFNWKVITTEEELLNYLSTRDEIGLDTETTGLDVFKDKLVGFSLGTQDDCVYIPLAHKIGTNYTGNLEKLGEILKTKKIWGFNAKFDMKMLKQQAGVEIKVAWCGYLAARLMNSSEPSNELKSLYIKYIDPNAKFYSFRELFKRTFDQYDPAIVGAYAAVDAMKHIIIGKWQEANMNKEAKRLLIQLELPLAHKLVDIELTGVQLDTEWCEELSGSLQKDLDAAASEIARDYEGLNPASPKQVAEWLYDKLKLPTINGRSTAEGILELYNHPLTKKILEYRKAAKALSTYAQKMPQVATEGIIHCTFNQYGADTGRFSSSNPNLQNIPKDNRFRKMFRARPGKRLVSCDYTQQEVYILAALANDESMKEAYQKGMDFYGYMASLVFEKPYEDCTKHGKYGELRNQMKSIVLGLNYDMGIKKLASDIGKSVEETRQIYNKFFEKCPRVKEFRQKNLDFAEKNGYVETILGRRRYFTAIGRPDYECDNKEVLETLNKLKNPWAIEKLIKDAAAEGIIIKDYRKQKIAETRQVLNSVIQGSAADMTKLAMISAANDEKLKALGCKIVLQIHDEIIAEFPEENAEEGGKLLAQLMIDVGTELIGLKMVCEPTVMEYWQKD